MFITPNDDVTMTLIVAFGHSLTISYLPALENWPQRTFWPRWVLKQICQEPLL